MLSKNVLNGIDLYHNKKGKFDPPPPSREPDMKPDPRVYIGLIILIYTLNLKENLSFNSRIGKVS